jgi:lambda family phage tail tape measure protein
LKKVYALTEQLKQAQLSELDMSTKWATGWQDAFSKYIDSATNAATMAGNAFSSITQNMNSAIDNFVETGKFKFGDFARSVIQDLLKIQLKASASKLLGGVSGGISSFLGSLFGGFFANGGQPPVGKASIVGEKGPELFIPKTAGTIVPNGAGVANSAQGNTYITNNISAIDAKSVAQLFAENRRTLFGSVQLAQKELSYGR